MNRTVMTFAAVAAGLTLTLTACGDAQPSATAHNLPPVGASGDRLLVVANLPGTDLPVMQQVGGGWVQTAPTEGDRVAEYAVVDHDGDGTGDPFSAVSVWASESALHHPELIRVLSPDETAIWALTPEQAATHPDLVPVTALLQ